MFVNSPTRGQLPRRQRRNPVNSNHILPQQQCKSNLNFLSSYYDLSYEQLREQLAVGQQLKIYHFLHNLQPADTPNTSSDVLPSAGTVINAKCNTVDFSDQLNPLLYHHNHLLLQCLQWITIIFQWLNQLNHLPRRAQGLLSP